MPQIEMTEDQYNAYMASVEKKENAVKRSTARKMAKREILEANKAQVVIRTEEIYSSL